MIVISGALVLVALVLLVIGIVGPELGFVYASIGVSLVSLVFLVIGILQRRGETLPATAGAPAPAPRVDTTADTATAVIPSQARAAAEPAPIADSADEELETGGTVLVVAGRPRYHVAGCRYLGGKDAEAIDVLDAREEGFTPCGVCKPDDALAALEAEEAEEARELEDEQADEPALALEEVEESTPTRVRAASRKAPAVREVPAAAEKPARASKATKAVPAAAIGAVKATKAPAKTAKAPAKAVPETVEVAPVAAPSKAAKQAAAKAPAKAPSKAATLAADSTPAAATAKRAGTVVVIPDRGRFHRAECRYVRGVDGAEDLTRAAATRQGFEACGVCKP